MARVTVTLKTAEREALVKLAQRERRDPREQAAKIVADELARRGLLPTEQRQLEPQAEPSDEQR